MDFQRSKEFLDTVLSYVKFPFDKEDIRMELQEHIWDRIDYYTQQGLTYYEAEEKAIKDMGDPKEIGIQLNKEHHPLIGWLYLASKVLVILFVIINIFMAVPVIIDLGYSIFDDKLIREIPKEDIVYKIDVNERVQIDDRVINFKNVVYDKNGTLHISYYYYDKKLWGSGWSLGTIGIITDDKGSKYYRGSSHTTGGIVSKGMVSVENFRKDAKTLIIEYDRYNRYYKLEIPLKSGENIE